MKMTVPLPVAPGCKTAHFGPIPDMLYPISYTQVCCLKPHTWKCLTVMKLISVFSLRLRQPSNRQSIITKFIVRNLYLRWMIWHSIICFSLN